MLIWIPVDGNDATESKVTKLSELKQWALVDFDKGTIQSTRFFDKRESFTEWADFVILKNQSESYIDLMNDGLMALCVREEETIPEIIEAFKFKELDEIGM